MVAESGVRWRGQPIEEIDERTLEEAITALAHTAEEILKRSGDLGFWLKTFRAELAIRDELLRRRQ